MLENTGQKTNWKTENAQIKFNSENQTMQITAKTTLPWFSRLLWHSARLNSGLCPNFSIQLKVLLSERLNERLSQYLKWPSGWRGFPDYAGNQPCVLPSATEPCRRLLHLFGTVCRRQYIHRRHYQCSAEDWRLNFCPVLQLFCIMNVSLYWLLRDPTLLLRVLAVLGLCATSSQFVIIIIIISDHH